MTTLAVLFLYIAPMSEFDENHRERHQAGLVHLIEIRIDAAELVDHRMHQDVCCDERNDGHRQDADSGSRASLASWID